jgi:hypothetical protein
MQAMFENYLGGMMENQLATRPGLMPALTIQDAIMRYNAVIEFTKMVMKEGKDYGVIPGVDKPTLLKPGSEKLCSLFGLAPVFEIVDKIVDFDKPLFYFQYRCNLMFDGRFMGSGIGSCNSHEKKYRYRSSERVCPACGKAAIRRSTFPPRGNPNGKPGWYCHAKTGGCGAQYTYDDPAISQQEVGKIENPDMADILNTVDKMAQKRALVAATLIVTNASEYFTQDLEDMAYIEGAFKDVTPEPKVEPVKTQEQPKAQPAPEPAYPTDKELFLRDRRSPEANWTEEAGDVDREENESADYSKMTNSEGVLYTDIDTKTLGNMYNSIAKALKKDDCTEEYKLTASAKMKAIQDIIKSRQ